MQLIVLFLVLLSLPSPVLNAASAKTDPNQIGTRDVGTGLNIYSRQSEIDWGRRWAHDLELQVKILDDAVTGEYVNRIGQKLVRNSDARTFLVIKVIQSEQINALALPGGFVYVTTGLIRMADNEAQLAGAIAHEIGHVAARHATRRQTRNQLSIPLVMLGGIPGFAIRVAFLKFSRAAECEADMLGMQYLYKTGYDPAAFVALLERLGSLEKPKVRFKQIFSAHPAAKSRILAARKVNEDLILTRESVTQTAEFETINARLGGGFPHPNASTARPSPELFRDGPNWTGEIDVPPVLKRPN